MQYRKLIQIILSLTLSLSVYAAENKTTNTTTSTKSSANIDPNKVVLNFENADIQSVIRAISDLSGKNFVVDPRVKGTVNIFSDKPISKLDSYKVLESALRMQGFAVVEADGVIKVLPESDAKTYGMQTTAGNVSHSRGDNIITKIFVLERGSAVQMASSIRPLISPNSSLNVYPNSNAIIISDYASNIKRISKIISSLTSARIEPLVINLKFAIASEAGQLLQTYLQGGGTSTTSGPSGGSLNSDGPAANITIDSATNSLIITSSSQKKLDELKKLVLDLDKNIANSNNNLHVVYLKNADANHIADVLRVVATGQENPDITATSTLAKFNNEPSSLFTGGSNGSNSTGTSLSASTNNNINTNKRNTTTATGSNNNQKNAPKILVQAEPTTNSLIIQAPDAIYRNLRMIIEMLDIRRAQVMIEAMIVDINSSTEGSFGIQWLVGAGSNSGTGGVLASNYAGGGNSLSEIGTIAATAKDKGVAGLSKSVFVGLVSGTTTIGGQAVPNIAALADMIAANSSINIISRPTLITLDNEEAKIMVGSNIGLANGSYQPTAGASGQIVTTYQRQDVGTFLQIKPLITQNGAIQLDIYQEDSQVDDNVQVADNNKNIFKRNMRTNLIVDDGQIIAIGGMAHDDVSIKKSGIPLLSSIPYLGWLFRWESRSHKKTNLVLFLRPVIIKNVEGYAALTNQRYKYIIDQQNGVNASGNIMLPTIKPINLDNQRPYNNVIPKQPDNQVNDLPIIDIRQSKINKTL